MRSHPKWVAVYVTHLSCMECGTITPIVRRKCKQRTQGHIKHLWCYRCRRKTAHYEYPWGAPAVMEDEGGVG